MTSSNSDIPGCSPNPMSSRGVWGAMFSDHKVSFLPCYSFSSRPILIYTVFDYWFDPTGFRVEHYADGDWLVSMILFPLKLRAHYGVRKNPERHQRDWCPSYSVRGAASGVGPGCLGARPDVAEFHRDPRSLVMIDSCG